jgi:CHAT domain-containing protein/tetratricopeptide (TPR) repeat protein
MSFLEQIFQKTVESEGTFQDIYNLLQENLAKLNDDLANELRKWAEDKLCKKQSEDKEQIARFIAAFSHIMLHFPLGSKASNTEIAIAGYKVLQTKYYTREACPQEWAWIQHGLGCAYNCRTRGETAENVEEAIKAFKLALEVRTPETLRQQWAETQTNLGITYCYRIRGEKADNLNKAIELFNSALQIYTPDENGKFPNEWARIQNEIGYAYLNLEKGDKAENIEKAIEAFKLALDIYYPKDSPEDWATTQNNIGNAYLRREKEDKANNIEKAINAFQSGLEVLNRENHPHQWARIKNNIGSAYLQKEKETQTDSFEEAIQAFELALQVYNRNDFPQELAITLGLRGYAYQVSKQYTEAYKDFAEAIEIAESQRSEIISGSGIEADKQKLAEEWNPYYQNIVEICLELAEKQPEYFARAIEYAEQSKARNLVELLNNKNLYPKKDLYLNEEENEEHCRKLDDLRRKISSEQRQKESQERLKQFIESHESIEEIEAAIDSFDRKLQELRKEQDNLLEEINKIDPDFKFTQQLNKISFHEIQDLIGKDTAIVEWYITNSKIIAFIITHNEERESKQQPWISSSEDLKNLINWCQEYFEAYYAPRLKKLEKDKNKQEELKKQWQSGLTTRFQKLAEILHINDILSRIPESCERLILIPHRFLHLLPLHALPLPKPQDKCLLDKFKGGVGYVPSCQLLQISQRLQRTEFSELFAVQNPKADLAYANLEVRVISQFFSSYEILKKEKAKEVNLKKSEHLPSSHCCHFSCHGKFNLKSPLESALILAEYQESEEESSAKDNKDKKPQDGQLTLAEIFGLTLDKCRLVTLSACETGMVDPDNMSDEYIGLPSGFLFAGSPSVVASLWKVEDISSALLMIKFYGNLIEHWNQFSQLKNGAVAIALNQAQIWLRNVTKLGLKEWIKENKLPLTPSIEDDLDKRLDELKNDEHPFLEPYYWAAFCAIGE